MDWKRKGWPAYRVSFPHYLLFGVPLKEYYCLGQEVYAPCDGIVVQAQDGYQERARTNLISDMSNAYKNAHYFDPEKDDVQLVSGNYIIMNCGENVYVALVHLQKRVYPGHRRTEYKKGRRDRESRSFREFFCFAFTFSAYGQQRHIDGKRPPLRF